MRSTSGRTSARAAFASSGVKWRTAATLCADERPRNFPDAANTARVLDGARRLDRRADLLRALHLVLVDERRARRGVQLVGVCERARRLRTLARARACDRDRPHRSARASAASLVG